ncbi:cation-translocating P-type ATPase [Nocardioides taihuensis]|uniref:Cation-translocating P-type ATPase n=1 Tax=Nocardioides taihuensis TaxID=1835606 RepID=A0ABW0BQ26_9ACTN
MTSTARPVVPAPEELLLEPLAQLTADTGFDPAGLTSDEAVQHLADTGPNELVSRAATSFWRLLVRQLVHPLALLLWLAAVLATTQSTALSVAIVAVIALNAAFALVQERHAEHAVAALTEFLPPHAMVVRDGVRREVPAREVVPGDLLLIEEGGAICADAKLVTGTVECDFSAVTGESAPVLRQAGAPAPAEGVRLFETPDVVLSGTSCVSGEATALVIRTGMATELGRIAALSSRTTQEPSPLERQVRRVAWLIAAVAIGVGVAFLPLGMLAGLSLADAAMFSIGLLVANVPEGLLPTITLALAVGVAEMARQGGLVKRLSAIETLGSTDVICTDKTGTLTQNRMGVHSVWDASAHHRPSATSATAIAAVLRSCTSADLATGFGDPTEIALLQAANRLSPGHHPAERTATFHFDPRLRLMTVLAPGDGDTDGGTTASTKGAPESVVSRCATALSQGAVVPLDQAVRDDIVRRLDVLAGHGVRLIACASRPWHGPAPTDRAEVEQDLTLLGFVALSDPVRDAVPDAVAQAHGAGLTIHVITGDNGRTAVAVAHDAGISAGDGPPVLVTGEDLGRMDDAALDAVLGSGRETVFARSTPEDKLRIATRLQALGHVVAMTGDGVNDAPALRRADIGVAMGASGTDVAREAATMVLTDDDFATIIAAIRAGRRVYDNVRKFIVYIFAHAIPEIAPFLLFALSGGAIPLGLTVAQILLIDLGTETLPALALGREREEPGNMQRPPRPRGENLITGRMLARAWGVLGVPSAVLSTCGFLWVLLAHGWSFGDDVGSGSPLHETYLTATTMLFAGIVACQIGTAMAARTDRVSLLRVGVLSNRLLLWGILFEVTLTAFVIYVPAVNDWLGTRPLGWQELLVLVPFPVVVWLVDEAVKAVGRRRSGAAQVTGMAAEHAG